MADTLTRSRQALVSAQTQALQITMQELGQVLFFIRDECPTAFSACFEAHWWPNIETLEMRQDWTTWELVVESRVETLTREIVQVYRDTYYSLKRS